MSVRWMALGVALTGCSPSADQPAAPASSVACNVGGDLIRPYTGKGYSDVIGATLKARSRSAVLRVVRPGQAVTMDFRADRLTIRLDEQGRIADASCG